jgi:hypothetical protein
MVCFSRATHGTHGAVAPWRRNWLGPPFLLVENGYMEDFGRSDVVSWRWRMGLVVLTVVTKKSS